MAWIPSATPWAKSRAPWNELPHHGRTDDMSSCGQATHKDDENQQDQTPKHGCQTCSKALHHHVELLSWKQSQNQNKGSTIEHDLAFCLANQISVFIYSVYESTWSTCWQSRKCWNEVDAQFCAAVCGQVSRKAVMTFKLLKMRANLHKRNTLLQCWVATRVAAARHEKTGGEATGKRGYVLGVSLASLTRFLSLFSQVCFQASSRSPCRWSPCH